jgi:surface antigen
VYAILIDGSFTFIEYNITGSTQKKRAYVSTQVAFGGTSSGDSTGWAALVGSKVPGYDNFSTPVSNKSFNKAQCTWYCWNRANYQTGKQLSFNSSANGYEWLTAVNTSNCTVKKLTDYPSAAPARDSIAVFKKKQLADGHVLYIEQVENNNIYFTEANYNAGKDGIYQVLPVTSFPTRSSTSDLLGYIYLR